MKGVVLACWPKATAVSLLAVSAVLATPAVAQSAPDAAPSDQASAPQTDAPRSENSGLADIVVTAQRREESLQRTGLAVSAVGGKDLAAANVTDVTGLTKLVPSLIVQPATGTSVGFYLRGVGSLVGNAFTENPVAFNYGQVYIARPAALLGTFYDIERVEVLKGPQGTLYGRNATGGAINVIPNRPVIGKTGMDISVEAGNYRAIKSQAAVNLPLGPVLALRLAGQVSQRDGYLSDGYDDENGQAARASLLFKPDGMFRALLTADYFHQGGHGLGSVLVPGPLVPNAPDPDDRIGGSDPRSIAVLAAGYPALINPGVVAPPKNDGFVNSRFWGVSANFDFDFGPATLTVIPAYRDSRPNYLSYNSGYYSRVNEVSKQKSVEARLTSNGGGPFKYVLGAFYFNEDQTALNNFIQGLAVNTYFETSLQNKSYAVFGQVSYELSKGFRIVGGARQTWEDKSNATFLRQTSFGVGPSSNISGNASFRKFTWKAGAEFDAGPQSLLYANVATGFKSGGFFIAAVDNTFQPETITAYTVGSKNRFFDNKLQFNIEGFYWDYSDQQVNYIGPIRTSATTVGSGLATANAGKSRIYGVEAELTFQFTRADRFGANLQYLNGKYTDFKYVAASANGAVPRTSCAVSPSSAFTLPAPGRAFLIDCSGRPQINSPKWSLNMSYEHVFDISDDWQLTFGARTKIESSRYLSPEYLPEEQQGAYRQSDLYVTLARPTDRFSVTGFVNNVEDRTVYAGTSLRPVLPVVYNILRPPRTYGLRVAAGF